MKILKNLLFTTLLIAGGSLMAQNEAPEPEFEKKGDLIKGRFYYEDGSIRQEGTYKNGKLHGQWISYDENGKKTALAYYNQGEKEGKWFFWNGDGLTEVDYQSNVIASVNTWKSKSSLVNKK